MFHCRNDELRRLHDLYSSDHLECAVIYGRRRVGKTALINEFVRDKNVIYFPALNTNARDNLIAFSRSIQNYLMPDSRNTAVYPSFDAAFDAVTDIARKGKLIFAIDELQYLAKADASLRSAISSTSGTSIRSGISTKSNSSIMEALRDHLENEWSGTDMLLILCGSSASYMERELFGRNGITAGLDTGIDVEKIKLEPLDYLDTAGFNPDLSPAENAMVYAVTGGIPHYINKLGVGKDIRDALINNLFDSSSYLFEEPENLLKTELREPAVYNSIIGAIANGKTRLGDIASVTGMESSACSKYITTLTDLGIVQKVEPVIGKSRRKTQYRIGDHLFRFWYRFVPENMMNIISGSPERVYDNTVAESMDQYMRLPFEEICRQYLAEYAEDLPGDIKNMGEWWGSVNEDQRPGKRKNTEAHLDIVAIAENNNNSSPGKKFVIGSCNYSDDLVEVSELDQMRSTVSEFTDANDECFYYIFAKTGFTPDLEKLRDAGEVRLVSIEDMYRRQL